MILISSILLVYVKACELVLTRYLNGEPWILLTNEGLPSMPQYSYESAKSLFQILGVSIGRYHFDYCLNDRYYLITDDRQPENNDFITWVKLPDFSSPEFDRIASQIVHSVGPIRPGTMEKFSLLTPFKRMPIIVDPVGFLGLPNVDNATCFINTVVQCLFAVPRFRWRFLKRVEELKLHELSFLGVLASVLTDYIDAKRISSKKMKRLAMGLALYKPDIFNYEQFVQFDPMEILQFTLDLINAELVDITKNPLKPGLLDDIFRIYMTRTVVSKDRRRSEPYDSNVWLIQRLPASENSKTPLNLCELLLDSVNDEVVNEYVHNEYEIRHLPQYLFVSVQRNHPLHKRRIMNPIEFSLL